MTGTSGPPPADGAPPGPKPRELPLLKARTWAIWFLVFAIILAAVFAATMPAFFRAAYHQA
jgi:hypothetical protein